jgi:hypothetical protein
MLIIFKSRYTQWHSWSRQCATSLKVAGSIPDGVIVLLHCHNPSDGDMAMLPNQPLEEMSTRYVSWGVNAAGATRADKYTTFSADCLEI